MDSYKYNQFSSLGAASAFLNRIWQPHSWRDFPALQQPAWHADELGEVTAKLKTLPSLTSAPEIETLKMQIAEAGRGHRFILQGGDCAERFLDCNETHISGRLRILSQMAIIIAYGRRIPVVRIGRMAGQYAKPRTDLWERTSEGDVLQAFRGDNVNEFQPTVAGRIADASRLLMAYHHSGATLNFMRTLVSSGDLELTRCGEEQNVGSKEQRSRGFASARYQQISEKLRDARLFFESIHQGAHRTPAQFEFYVSHEALILPYEESMTRFMPHAGSWYNMGAHMLWIGERTRHLSGAHVEYCRGIANPIGIKVGPDSDPQDILDLVRHLNPHNDQGKITLITRFGIQQVESKLPRLLEAFRHSGLNVTWTVDPMHGNTEKTSTGIKTRQLRNIVGEMSLVSKTHKHMGTILGGVHLELTHESVTECLGGYDPLEEADLLRRYETWCDPRLNKDQSLEVAFALTELF